MSALQPLTGKVTFESEGTEKGHITVEFCMFQALHQA